LDYILLHDVLDKTNYAGRIECFLPSLVVKKIAARYPDITFHDMFLAYCNYVVDLVQSSYQNSLLVHIHASTLDIGVIEHQAGRSGSLNVYLTHAFKSENELSVLIKLLPALLSEGTTSHITDVYIVGYSHECLDTFLKECGSTIHHVSLRQIATHPNEQRNSHLSTLPSLIKLSDLIRGRFNISLGQFMVKVERILANKDGVAPISELKKLHELTTLLISEPSNIPLESIADTLCYLTKVLENDFSAIDELKRCLIRSIVGTRTKLRIVTFISNFSGGKSTLLNALLGETILSADMRAETKCVTKVIQGYGYAEIIEYTDEIRVIKYATSELLSERVKMHTSVRGDEHGEIVDYYVVVPKVVEWEDTLLVDTPGYNSRFEDHNSVADSAWSESDIVIAIYVPSQVGETTFTEKARQVIKSGKEVVFVITKCDQIEGCENVLRAELCAALSHDVQVIFISGYHALFGKKWLNGSCTLDDIQQEWDLFVNEDGFRITGANMHQEHASHMLYASNIGQLEKTLWTMLGESV
jgi:ribosome biogenesis GTPase A